MKKTLAPGGTVGTCSTFSISPLSELPDAPIDAVDRIVGRGRAGGDAHGAGGGEPFLPKIRLTLNVVHARAPVATGVHELARVVAVCAADDDDDVALARELDGGALTLLGRQAHRVDEAD